MTPHADHLEQYEDATGEELELDVVALCFDLLTPARAFFRKVTRNREALTA